MIRLTCLFPKVEEVDCASTNDDQPNFDHANVKSMTFDVADVAGNPKTKPVSKKYDRKIDRVSRSITKIHSLGHEKPWWEDTWEDWLSRDNNKELVVRLMNTPMSAKPRPARSPVYVFQGDKPYFDD